MPTLSPRFQRRAAQQELDIQQQQADTGQQGSVVDMLSKLYGLGQSAELQPEKLRGLRAETAGHEYTNSVAPQTTEATLGLARAQTNRYNRPDPLALIQAMLSGAIDKDEVASQLLGPEAMAGRNAAKAKTESDRAAAVAADQAIQQKGAQRPDALAMIQRPTPSPTTDPLGALWQYLSSIGIDRRGAAPQPMPYIPGGF